MRDDRAAEQLRQEREAFDQAKAQARRWFALRLYVGYLGIGLLIAIAVFAAYLLLGSVRHSPQVQVYAAVALLIDMVGLVMSIFKLVLQPGNTIRLEPVTTAVERQRTPSGAPSRTRVQAPSSRL